MQLKTDNIRKSYKNREVVKGVSVELNKGEIVGLLGPNGAGKTTSFYMIVGLVKPDSGNVYLDGENITKTPMYKRSKMGIGYLPQEVSGFRKLSVEDNILAILQMTNLSKKEQLNRLEELILEFGLDHVRNNGQRHQNNKGLCLRVEMHPAPVMRLETSVQATTSGAMWNRPPVDPT